MDVTLGAAMLAGLLSFLSPCVLPVVPAYLGQLGILTTSPVGGLAMDGGLTPGPVPLPPARATGWRAMPNAFAFVLGFTVIFTVFGIAVYSAAGPLRDNLAVLRQIGGVILVILGLNLMGVIKLQTLARSWKPLERMGDGGTRQRRGGMVGGFLLGSVFAVGWTPCIGPVLGSILLMAAVGASPQVVGLLVAYSLGLGIPFILVALAFDRAPLLTRPLLRYGRSIEIIGGALIIILGLAMIFDWLGWLSQQLAWLDFSTWIEIGA